MDNIQNENIYEYEISYRDHDIKFPNPDTNTDEVACICMTIQKDNDYKNIILCTDTYNDNIENECDIYTYKNENSLLSNFVILIDRLNNINN